MLAALPWDLSDGGDATGGGDGQGDAQGKLFGSRPSDGARGLAGAFGSSAGAPRPLAGVAQGRLVDFCDSRLFR